MDLIDRYLHAVRGFLPSGSQDDIVRELGEDIRTQAADRLEALGRPLTEDDEAALLKQFGHPMLLAAKYRRSQHLISPVVFPYYWLAVKISVGIALGVQAAIAIAMVVSGQPGADVIGRLASFPFTGLVTLFGWMTIVFAIVDLNVRQITSLAAGTWDPRTLTKPPRALLPKNIWSAGFELVASTVGLGWWLAIPQYPFLVFGPAAAFLAMGPTWKAIHIPIAIVWLASLAVRWTLLFRPGLKRLRVGFGVAGHAVELVVANILLRADQIVAMAPGADAGKHATDLANLVRVVDASCRIALVVVAIAAVVGLVRVVLRRNDA
jgi:hypothetical protein